VTDPAPLPQWEFFDVQYSSSALHTLALRYGVRAIVIDKRITEGGGYGVDLLGFPPSTMPPVTQATVTRLTSFRWLSVLLRTPHYTVLVVR
jgi:hypothetical protein